MPLSAARTRCRDQECGALAKQAYAHRSVRPRPQSHDAPPKPESNNGSHSLSGDKAFARWTTKASAADARPRPWRLRRGGKASRVRIPAFPAAIWPGIGKDSVSHGRTWHHVNEMAARP